MEDKVLILVAERDPYSAEMTEHFLRTEGYHVELAFNPEDALGIAVDRTPNVAIVDLLISGVQGQRLCSELRQRTETPIVAISSLASEEAARAVGASAFLQKPIEPLHLVTTVQELLGRSSANLEAKR